MGAAQNTEFENVVSAMPEEDLDADTGVNYTVDPDSRTKNKEKESAVKNEHLQHPPSKNRNVARAEASNTISHQPSSARIKKHNQNAWNQGLSETRELLVAYTNAQWKAMPYSIFILICPNVKP
jgi:hypothetical protein